MAAQVGFILADSVRDAADAAVDHIADANALRHGSGSLDVMALSHVAHPVHGENVARVRYRPGYVRGADWAAL
ncbi:hypothetical protein AMK22_31640 [Streptomyces sp. CB01580]|nr:hypothetical protein AMK22_31640 [Streptomyces sp. CB01580]